MKKNKGFTLIELLAVIVILAVIGIIAVPIIINVIESAKKGALKDALYGLQESATYYFNKNMQDSEEGRILKIENGEQIDSYEKLSYKGKVSHAYIAINLNGEVAICVDDGKKYFASLAQNSTEVIVDEGACTDEFDNDVSTFITIGSSSYTGLRMNIKAYANKSNMPKKSSEGNIAVITDKKISEYNLSPTTPTNPKDGSIWVVLNNNSENQIITKTSKIGVSYVLQYENDEWNLKEAYVFNDRWVQLSDFNGEFKWEYDYSGEYETFKAPYSGYYEIELWGAGYSRSEGGAYTKGDIYLDKDEEIYIYVGGQPWNGGGTGYIYGYGATDVRTVSTSTKTTWNEIDSLRSRIMVAAGSGGTGEAAGGLVGYTGTATSCDACCGKGGTQIAGGAQPARYSESETGSAGGFGYGGRGGRSTGSGGSASGGGGWFGGSGATGAYHGGWNGGGGSSYISGHRGSNSVDETGYHTGNFISNTGKYFVNTKMIDGRGYEWTNEIGPKVNMPTHDHLSLVEGNQGNGYAIITFKNFVSMTSEEYKNLGIDLLNVWQYVYLGYYQTFKAEKTGTYKIELWGAGYTQSAGGAYTSGEIELQKGQILYVYVGGQPWNGGGLGYTYGYGATDVRTIPTSTITTWNELNSLKSRIMVAAGSGGTGEAAGGLVGYIQTSTPCDACCGKGGTQIAGGAQPARYSESETGSAGGFGYGGRGGRSVGSGGSASGGGGWFGGSGASGAYHGGWNGGGGSSYISGHEGCIGVKEDATLNSTSATSIEDSYSYTGLIFKNTKMIDGAGYSWTTQKGSSVVKMPTQDYSTTMIGNTGNGYALITFIK